MFATLRNSCTNASAKNIPGVTKVGNMDFLMWACSSVLLWYSERSARSGSIEYKQRGSSCRGRRAMEESRNGEKLN